VLHSRLAWYFIYNRLQIISFDTTFVVSSRGCPSSVLDNNGSGHRILNSEIQFDQKTLLYMLQSLIGISFPCNLFEDLICVLLLPVVDTCDAVISGNHSDQTVYNFSIVLISSYDIRDEISPFHQSETYKTNYNKLKWDHMMKTCWPTMQHYDPSVATPECRCTLGT
jgi:hypothetical protein